MPIEEEGVTGGSSASNPTPRRGGNREATLPTVGEAGPAVRFWSNMTGLTDPMCDEEDEGHLISNVTEENIAYNLQQMGDRERAEAYMGMIQFLAMFMAELMKAIAKANGPDVIVLLQGRVERKQGSVWTGEDEGLGAQAEQDDTMQSSLCAGPGSFAKVLVQLQEDLEQMNKDEAIGVANTMHDFLLTVAPKEQGNRDRDRRQRLAALLVAFGNVDKAGWLWARVRPYLGDEMDKGNRNRASSSGEAAGALDDDDEAEGILVRRGPQEEWRQATMDEARELRSHDRDVREETRMQELADEDSYQRYQAAKTQDWDDWALAVAMNTAPEPARKRVRVTMVLGVQGGAAVAEGTLEGTMAVEEVPTVTMAMDYTALAPQDNLELAGPPTPDTVHIPEQQVAQQLGGVELPVDLDVFLRTEHGQRWYSNWLSGQVDEEMVVARWGRAVLELFQVTKTIEDDPHAYPKRPGRRWRACRYKWGRMLCAVGKERSCSAKP